MGLADTSEPVGFRRLRRWNATPASSISLANVYSGQPGPFRKSASWSNTGDASLSEWAVGVNVTISETTGSPVTPGAVLDLRRVDATAAVVLPDGEMLDLSATSGSGPP